MRLSADDFARFHVAAAHPARVAIIGAGRWGRVWVSVLARIRGGGAGLVLVARSNFAETRDWVRGEAGLLGVDVVPSLADAGRPFAALIASRPRDHVRDGLQALSQGAHILVEKPISDDAQAAHALIEAASAARLALAVDTEFAFVPAFHQVAALPAFREASRLDMLLTWTDPPAEIRHGAVKRRHEEIHLLQDLLPHALSVFRVFGQGDRLHLVGARLARDDSAGEVELADAAGNRYRLHCDVAAAGRQRLLSVKAGESEAVIDFSTPQAAATVDGTRVDLADWPGSGDGTLAMSYGAFVSQALGLSNATPISAGLDDVVRLDGELASMLRRP